LGVVGPREEEEECCRRRGERGEGEGEEGEGGPVASP